MKKFLIVDDEKEVFLFLRRIVENKFGFEATWAENGLNAIKELENTTFDAIIMDVNMPIMGGLETIKIIRKNDELSKLPILVFSSESDRQKVNELISLNITDYILKPISYQEVIKKISKLFNSISVNNENALKPKKISVLLASSDEKILKTLQDIESDKFEITQTKSGVEAFSIFMELKPNVIIIGDNLGLINSSMLFEKIKSFKNPNLYDNDSLPVSKIIYCGNNLELPIKHIFDETFNLDEEVVNYLIDLGNS
jgi:DNA-binding response OmpR family regulator